MTEAIAQARPAWAEGSTLDAQLRTCIHCGLCLPACPTYLATGDEAESPRGRLRILSGLLGPEGPSEARGEPPPAPGRLERGPLDRCLGCRNCETVCPSGVPYGHLLEATRRTLGPQPDGVGPLLTWLIDHVLAHPRRLALAGGLGWLLRRGPWEALVRGPTRALLTGLPRRRPVWPARASAVSIRGDVALLAGCAQPVYTPEVLPAAVRLVRAAGGRPYVPPGQGCCGALSYHAGSTETARSLARRLIDAMGSAPEIVVPSAGCSAHMRGYGELLEEDPVYADRARELAARTTDLVEWLGQRSDQLRLRPDPRRVAYHPPCHHTHAQHIVEAPRQLLGRVPELQLARIEDEERCCGSAGSYSLAHPELARTIRDEKIARILAAGPEVLITANPGCELFLHQGLRERGTSPAVVHLAPFLADHLGDVP